MFNSQHTEDTYRGSQSVSAFQTTFYSAVPLPDMHADADVFQMLVPSYRRRYRYHAVLDCFNIPPTTANDLSERHHAYMDLSSNAVVGNKRCPTVDERENEGQDLVQQRRRQRWRQDLASRAAVLLQAVEGAFFPGSIVALLLTVFVVLCVNAAAVALDGVVRTLIDVDGLETLVERGIEDLSNSVNAFSDFLNTELTSPLCVDRVDLDVLKLTSLLHRRRFTIAGIDRISALQRNCSY